MKFFKIIPIITFHAVEYKFNIHTRIYLKHCIYSATCEAYNTSSRFAISNYNNHNFLGTIVLEQELSDKPWFEFRSEMSKYPAILRR